MQDLEEGPPSRRHLFTMAHGHYMAMGGVVVDTTDGPEFLLLHFGERHSLTFGGLNFLLEVNQDLLPNLSKEEIYDKSKASGLAKTLVCLQAAWFCTQIVARIASHLTISILELKTFAHALCTLLIYWLGWNKPMDVTEPTLIRGEAAHPVIVLLFVLNYEGFDAEIDCPKSFEFNICTTCPHKARVVFYHMPSSTILANGRNYQQEKKVPHMIENHQFSGIRAFGLGLVLDRLHRFALRLQRHEYPHEPVSREAVVYFPTVGFPKSLIQCLELARIATLRGVRIKRGKYLQKHKKNIRVPNSGDNESKRFLCEAMTGVAIAGLTYGGLHLTTWNVPMPFRIKPLWRVCCVPVTLSGPACLRWP